MLLSMAVQQLCYMFGSDLVQSGLFCRPANIITVLSIGSNPVMSCINCGKCLPHTPFKHFTDTSSQAVLMLMPFKMLDERRH
jgi:hypothetical protein